ncbi:tripartite motif-containing protein 54-like [Rhinatrema bivittatum]|uniref:tripartite motif-containing protein 54-like n=1 Tax=Rhinatrema bivittatum TaxID=194408 RepID=UPI00112CD220|nr:tripartite motif-containing protein 54-like [Rhinatrema bivittatum]
MCLTAASLLPYCAGSELPAAGGFAPLFPDMSVRMEYEKFARDTHTMDSLERQLICPICLEVFTKPVVILPCQHNLCRKCSNDVFQSRGTAVGSGGRFRCPSCRHEVVLDRHGVYGLQRNLLVENIIDIYKQESARAPDSSQSLLKTEQPSCEDHEEEKINIYCVTCGLPTCSLCKVFGEHKDCEVAPLSDIYKKQKSELTDGIGALVAANDRIQLFISNLQRANRNIEENCKAKKQALGEKFDRMFAILEERKKIMTQRVTYEQDEKSSHVKSLVRSYSDRMESASKLVDAALHAMEEPQMAVFLRNTRSLIQKISEVAQSSEVEELDLAYENMEHYSVDFNAEERVLYQLDFLKVEEEAADFTEGGAENGIGGDPACLTMEPLMEGGGEEGDAKMQEKEVELETGAQTSLSKVAESEALGDAGGKTDAPGALQTEDVVQPEMDNDLGPLPQSLLPDVAAVDWTRAEPRQPFLDFSPSCSFWAQQ